MKMNYLELFEVFASKKNDKIQPPEAHSIIAEGTGIGKQANEDKGPWAGTGKPIQRNQYRVTGPRCIECGWSKP